MLIFDIETDGLLCQVSEVHCIGIYDTEADQHLVYNDQGNQEPIIRGVQMLHEADMVVGHNIIGYDVPVLSKLYPWFECPAICMDTLLLSRLYHPNMIEVDKRHKWKHMPLQMYGRHSLESYGYRLGEYKGEFGKTADWKSWSQEMEDYMIQDVKVTTKLCKHFEPYLNGSK